MSARRQSGTRGAGALVAFAAALTALLPAPASASAGHPSAGAPVSAAFTVRGSNGFRIDVGSEGGAVTIAASERRPPIATFSPAGRPRPADTSNGASSIYRARGSSLDPAVVDAPLGRLGRISVSFHPSGETRVTVLPAAARPGSCARPVRIARRLGTFTGTIEFQGEDGYTAVAATRARGSVGTPLPLSCAAASGSSPVPGAAALAAFRPPTPGTAVLRAVNRRAGTSFRATTTSAGVAFLATLEERLGAGVVVSRRAFAGAPTDTFSFDRALGAARVEPPAPFSGVARYDSSSGSHAVTWEGNLRATFPGVSVPMTGAGFRPSLEPGR